MTKEEEKQLIENSKVRLMRALVNANINTTEVERAYLGTILEDEIKTLLTICSTGLPVISPSRFKMRANNGSIGGYHPIDGRWYQIYQVMDKNNKIRYYTNGVEETKNLEHGLDLESSS